MFRRRPTPIASRTRSALFGVALAIFFALLAIPVLPGDSGLEPGDRASRTFTAAQDAQYESEALTEAARETARNNVRPVAGPRDPDVTDAQLDAANDFFDAVEAARMDEDSSPSEQLAMLEASDVADGVSRAALSNLIAAEDEVFDELRELTLQGIETILSSAVVEGSVSGRIAEFLSDPGVAPLDPTVENTLRAILVAFVVPNADVDEEATEALRDRAEENVPEQIVTYAEGQLIAAEGQVLDEAMIEALNETGVLNDSFDYYDLGAGILIAVVLGGLLGIFLYQLQPFPAPTGRRMLLTGIWIVAVLVGVRIGLPLVLPDEEGRYLAFALPVAAAAMVTASFAELRFASIVAIAVGAFAVYISATAPTVAGAEFSGPIEPLQLVLVFTMTGLAGAVAVHRADRLGRYAMGAVAVAVTTAVILLAFWMLNDTRETRELGWIGLVSVGNGLASSVLSIGAYVILSMVLGVTTRLQLMELAQAGHPLLRRLQDEAPGTFHHSMMVGTIAERAADRIGADSLLVRTGAYYHDIGKLAKPHYYIENMLDRAPSPHDTMDPEESARIILEHVTNGVDIARKNRLPDVVRDFIPEHHGTRLVAYFYRQASQNGSDVNPERFRYKGPLPQTKESAIVMLADSCEALVRARQVRTGTEIDALVDSVFAERLAEGQFDDCDITMRDLQQVAESFKATLRAIYHPRIEYPEPVSESAERTAARPG